MIKVKTDSRKIKNGQDTFVAIEGYTVDGHDYIQQAINNGATKIVAQKKVNIESEVEIEIVDNTHKYLVDYLVDNYSEQLKELKIIGLTGTNGKTTTCFLAYQMLQELGVKAAYIGTIGFYMGNVRRSIANTTPDILEMYNLLLEAKQNDCKVVVMEVSSHALDLSRIEGLKFDVAGFTNLTQDHLDYHETMENYLQVKTRILNYLKEDGAMIINQDDEHYHSFVDSRAVLIGFNGKDYKINDKQFDNHQTTINFTYDKEYKVTNNLVSLFNVYNYMTALAMVHALGYKIEDIIDISLKLKAPNGRLHTIPVKGGSVVVDYAHNPDALKQVITIFKKECKGRIITVVGCTGDRDRTKRPIMGEIATSNSDYVFFTNDDPHFEDPIQIINDIISDLKMKNYEVELNRAKAIRKAMDMIEPGDIVLVLGKGHEENMIIGNKAIHHCDSEEVENYNKELVR